MTQIDDPGDITKQVGNSGSFSLCEEKMTAWVRAALVPHYNLDAKVGSRQTNSQTGKVKVGQS